MGMLVVLLKSLHHPQAHADRVSADIKHKGPQPNIKGNSGCRALFLLWALWGWGLLHRRPGLSSGGRLRGSGWFLWGRCFRRCTLLVIVCIKQYYNSELRHHSAYVALTSNCGYKPVDTLLPPSMHNTNKSLEDAFHILLVSKLRPTMF